jgi:hypothetical protein
VRTSASRARDAGWVIDDALRLTDFELIKAVWGVAKQF